MRLLLHKLPANFRDWIVKCQWICCPVRFRGKTKNGFCCPLATSPIKESNISEKLRDAGAQTRYMSKALVIPLFSATQGRENRSSQSISGQSPSIKCFPLCRVLEAERTAVQSGWKHQLWQRKGPTKGIYTWFAGSSLLQTGASSVKRKGTLSIWHWQNLSFIAWHVRILSL